MKLRLLNASHESLGQGGYGHFAEKRERRWIWKHSIRKDKTVVGQLPVGMGENAAVPRTTGVWAGTGVRGTGAAWAATTIP